MALPDKITKAKNKEELLYVLSDYIPAADTLIDGCGEWAMQQVRQGENYRKGHELGSL